MAQASSRRGNAQGQRPRHIPQRTCVGCRSTQEKRGLLRIVRTAQGTVQVDATGKQPGRGAYLHRDPACLKEGLRKGRLAHALRAVVSQQDQTALEEQLREALATMNDEAGHVTKSRQAEGI